MQFGLGVYGIFNDFVSCYVTPAEVLGEADLINKSAHYFAVGQRF